MSNLVTLKIEKTPLLFSKKYRYSLSDFSYGERIVFENDEPRYYFNVFDEAYSQLLKDPQQDPIKTLTKQR